MNNINWVITTCHALMITQRNDVLFLYPERIVSIVYPKRIVSMEDFSHSPKNKYLKVRIRVKWRQSNPRARLLICIF